MTAHARIHPRLSTPSMGGSDRGRRELRLGRAFSRGLSHARRADFRPDRVAAVGAVVDPNVQEGS
jgi:hypothetical protein